MSDLSRSETSSGQTKLRWWQRLPARLPGGLTRQFGQWYAEGRDSGGVVRCGVGSTRQAARSNLGAILRAVERYHNEKGA